MIVGAIDKQTANAGLAHFAKRDFLRALRHLMEICCATAMASLMRDTKKAPAEPGPVHLIENIFNAFRRYSFPPVMLAGFLPLSLQFGDKHESSSAKSAECCHGCCHGSIFREALLTELDIKC